MMDDDGNGMRLTAREWFAARIVLIGGFIIAIAVAGYFTWTQHQQAQQAAAAALAQQKAAEQAAAGPTQAQLQARMALVVCVREVVNAETAGIVPGFAKLTSAAPKATKVRGRYTCTAATDVTKYTVTGDLICEDMRKADCAKLYSVTTDDGTVLYQAKN